MDVVGTQAELGIIGLGRDLDANDGGVGQGAARSCVALIRGGDGQVILTPEVLGRLVVQIAVDERVEIIE
ncbi:hypothetical protein D3C84_1252180 [compost metagenome]